MIDDMKMTKDGLKELQDELKNRKGKVREEIAQSLKLASEQGDLSENAAYKTAMEEKEFNENRIQELEEKIAKAVVVERDATDKKAGLGETVIVVRESDNAKREYHLVGENEADPSNYKISVESPIGRALHKKSIGDIITVKSPNGEEIFRILDIK